MPEGFDASRPRPGSMTGWPAGKDNVAADREQAAKLTDLYPPLPGVLRDGRGFAVARAARQGIAQLVDLGCGLPASWPVSETFRAVLPAGRVAYVDHDPVVTALLAGDGIAAVHAGGTAARPARAPGRTARCMSWPAQHGRDGYRCLQRAA